jgi:hypothetical protein
MWFLWASATFLVVMFSTSQLLAYISCFYRFPEMMKDLPPERKRMILIGFLLHLAITIIWIVLVCTVNTINKHYVAVLISGAIALVIAILGVANDKITLYQNFRELTGKADEEREEQKRQEIRGMIDNFTRSMAHQQGMTSEQVDELMKALEEDRKKNKS